MTLIVASYDMVRNVVKYMIYNIILWIGSCFEVRKRSSLQFECVSSGE